MSHNFKKTTGANASHQQVFEYDNDVAFLSKDDDAAFLRNEDVDDAHVMGLTAAACLLLADEIDEGEEHKRKRCWVKPYRKTRQTFGNTQSLMKELTPNKADVKNFIRMDEDDFNFILAAIRPDIEKQDTVMRNAIPAEERLAITLRYLATGESFMELDYNSKLSKTFLSIAILEVCEAILKHLKDQFLKPPVQPDNWNGILDTLNYKSECSQIKFGRTQISGEEDCLYLNVFSPATKCGEKLPVMFYIHGGGFVENSGDSTFNGPEFLVEKDVILVTFNYRLALFGFLSLNDDVYSGNMGLKDSLKALQWVNENIEHFNGDPNRITMFGHSAGAIITHLLAISPAGRGLFERIIMLSGTALLGFTQYDWNQRDAMFDLAKREQNTDDYASLVTFLQTADSHKLFYGSQPNRTTIPGRLDDRLYWTPVIESKQSITPIITNWPEHLIESQHNQNYDAMFGLTSHESLFLVGPEVKDPALLEPFDEKFEISLPHPNFKLDFNSDEYKEMAAEIRKFYFGELGSVNNDTLYEYIDLLSDAMFVYGIDRSVKINLAHSTGATYYFRFSVDAQLNVLKQLAGVGELNGSSHADELCYAFKCDFYSDTYYKSFDENSIERQTINRITTLWTNFAKYGNPTPNNNPTNWKPVTSEKHNFLDIRNEGLTLTQNLNCESIRFWDDLFDKYKHYAIIVGETGTTMPNGNLTNKNN